MAVKNDLRDPDTAADKATPGTSPAADPAAYGFTTIQETEQTPGAGAIEATRVEPLSSVPDSTFASRAKAVRGAESKAIQSAENK